MQSDLAKAANDTSGKPYLPRLWSLLWRGALGGVLGVFVFVGYALYRYPYGVVGGSSLPPLFLIAGVSGSLTGAMAWLLSRLLRRRLGGATQMTLGMILTATLIALYLYSKEGVDDDLKRFITNSLVFGLAVGGLASAMARSKLRNSEH